MAVELSGTGSVGLFRLVSVGSVEAPTQMHAEYQVISGDLRRPGKDPERDGMPPLINNVSWSSSLKSIWTSAISQIKTYEGIT